MFNPSSCYVWHWTSDLNLYMHIPVCYQNKYVIIIVFVFEMNVMYIDYVYGCYKHVYGCNACILTVYMGAMYMYIDGVYECYIKRLLYDIFHIDPGISPRLPYQARQWSWRADMGRGLIPGTMWTISCHNLFIPYFTLSLTFNIAGHILTDKLRK